MATIKINLDAKSFKNAIKEIQAIQDKLKTEVPSLFIDKCLGWIQDKANQYLSQVQMSGNIIADIQGSWNIEPVNSNLKRLVNTSEKAVFVEFGVGSVGQTTPHPNSNETGYEYNIDNGKKDIEGRWHFKADSNYDVDLVVGHYTQENDWVTTKGSPANLYLYNAAMDLISTGIYKQLWLEAMKIL